MKKNIFLLVLSLLIAFHLLNIFDWYQKSHWPIGKDYWVHLSLTTEFINKINNLTSWKEIMFISPNDNPPFYYWTASLLYLISEDYKILFLNSSLYLIVLLCSVYGIGTYIKNKEVGIVAAILLSFFPYIYFPTIQYNLALATAAMSCLIIYVILLTDKFTNISRTILFGCVLVIGGFTRQLVLLYISGPLVINFYAFLQKTKKNQELQKKD